jgi:hypothetical protein
MIPRLVVPFITCVTLVCSASATASVAGLKLLSPTEVTTLAQEEDISTQQAESDLQLQQRAGNIAGTLESTLGANYSGVWFDLKTGQFHVGIGPNVDRASVEAVVQKTGVARQTEFESVPATTPEVEHAQEEIGTELTSLVHKQQASVVYDFETHSVRIQVATNLAPSSIEKAQNVASTNTVKTEMAPVSPQSLQINANACTFPFCNLPLRGGIPLISSANSGQYHVCTSGFFVQDERGYPYLLTAGHCFYPEGTAWFNNQWGTAFPPHGEIGCAMGFRIASGLNEEEDVGVIATEGCEPPEPNHGIVAWGSNENYAISSTPLTAYQGLFECHMGENSGNQCGIVQWVNVATPIDYSKEGRGIIALRHTDQICALSLPGDSGGPWAAGGYGTAIHVAGNEKKCNEAGAAIGYELSYALSDINLHLN